MDSIEIVLEPSSETGHPLQPSFAGIIAIGIANA